MVNIYLVIFFFLIFKKERKLCRFVFFWKFVEIGLVVISNVSISEFSGVFI